MAQLLDTYLFNDSNLQEYYTLEDANADKNGNNLTNNNTVTFTTAKYNNGADGGSSDGNKSLSIASNLGFGGGDYSISLWVKLNTEIASGLYYFCEIVDATTHNTVLLQYDYNGGTRQLSVQRVRLGVAADTGTAHDVTLGTSSFHHIVWTYNDSSNTLKLYLDNVEVQSFSSSGNGSSGGTSGFHILEGRTANDNSTLGIIDDVALFNKTLAAHEISTIYNEASSPLTLSASGDTMILDTNPTTNFSSQNEFFVGEYNGGAQIGRALIKFDLSGLSGETITSATLKLYDWGSNFADNTRDLRVYRVKRTVVITEATWNVYSSGNNWGTAGCADTTNDREATDIGSLSIDATETLDEEYAITLDTTAIQEMVDGDFTNNGFLLKMDTETNDMHDIQSNESARTAARPVLVIEYSSSTAYTKEFTETVTLTEVFSRDITRSFSETITLSEVFSRAITKTFTETAITISDTFSYLHAHFLSFAETINISEVFTRAMTRTFSETVTLSEVFSYVKAKYLSFTDSISMSDIMWRWKRNITSLFSKDSPASSTWNQTDDNDSTWNRET